MAVASQAATIVNWGASGGSTTVVTSGAGTGAAAGLTYDLISPVAGDGGYTGQNFYGAQTEAFNATIINQDLIRLPDGSRVANPDAIDYMQLVHNGGGAPDLLNAMVAFESQDWLATANDLESMTVRWESRGGDSSTASFLIETTDGWYKSIENSVNTSTSVPMDWSLDLTGTGLGWVAFSEFGLSGGAVAADITDIQSAGVYFAAVNTSANFFGTKVEYVNVTTVPEPATIGMLGLGAVLTLLIRRRTLR